MADCPNREKNLENCPCTDDCSRKGKCCECIAYHKNSTSWPLPACLR